jgi:ABC-type nitrate/sulfonate/bicarbonate transport system permease component
MAESLETLVAGEAGESRLARTLRPLRFLVPVLTVSVAWELVAQAGVFDPALFPSLATVGTTMLRLATDGTLLQHTGYTLARLVVGFIIGAVLGVALGMAMARSERVEEFFLPLISFCLPIPPLALVPLFIVWFGLGNLPTILLTLFASAMPIVFSAWTGVKTVDPVLLRAAASMRASGRRLYRHVILPAALPFILSGLRIGLARAWRAVVAGEMVAASFWGLGWMIFAAREFLSTDIMIAGIVLIGAVGYAMERWGFQAVEQRTVIRWGMVQSASVTP